MARPSPWEKKLTTRPRNVGTPPASTRPSRRQSSAMPVAVGSCLQISDEGTLRAIVGQHLALDGPPERDAVFVHRHAHGQVGEADVGQDALGLVDETHDGSFLLREFLFDERGDLFVPNCQRRLASVPIRQPPDPLGEEDAVVARVGRPR